MKERKRNKAQIKLFETFAVLVIFIILVGFALVFYGQYKKVALKQKAIELKQLEALKVALIVSNLPELKCTSSLPEAEISSEHCIDLLKLNKSKELMKANPIYYFDLFKRSNITIKELYPEDKSWELYSYNISKEKSKLAIEIPIPLYDPIEKNARFGVIHVETY